MKKQLSFIEKSFYQQSKLGSINGSLTLFFSDILSSESVEKAVSLLGDSQPSLLSTIIDKPVPAIVAIPENQITCSSYDVANENDWREILESQLAKGFVVGEPLVRFFLVKHNIGSEIIIIYDHRVIDGLNYSHIATEFLSILFKQKSSKLRFGPLIDEILPIKPGGYHYYLNFTRDAMMAAFRLKLGYFNPPLKTAKFNQRTNSRGLTVSAQQVSVLRSWLKLTDINLSAYLSAIAIQALHLTFFKVNQKARFGINTPVSLRRSLKKNVSPSEIGLYLGSQFSVISMTGKESVLDIARSYHHELKKDVKRGTPFTMAHWFSKTVNSLPSKADDTRYRPTLNLSHLNEMPELAERFGKHLVDCRASGSLWPLDSLMVVFARYDGRINIEVLYSKERIEATKGEAFYQHIKQAIFDLPTTSLKLESISSPTTQDQKKAS